jgi:hypothetical protein
MKQAVSRADDLVPRNIGRVVRSPDITNLLQDSLADMGFEGFSNSDRNCSLLPAIIPIMLPMDFISETNPKGTLDE